MFFKGRQVKEADNAGISDLVIDTLAQDLRVRGARVDVVPLEGGVRLPRIELWFRSLTFKTVDNEDPDTAAVKPGWTLLVDYAVVSAKDQVTFAGRVEATGWDDDIAPAAEETGHLISKTLH
jgi:hypothetical protein